jgi:hypothetical protein
MYWNRNKDIVFGLFIGFTFAMFFGINFGGILNSSGDSNAVGGLGMAVIELEKDYRNCNSELLDETYERIEYKQSYETCLEIKGCVYKECEDSNGLNNMFYYFFGGLTFFGLGMLFYEWNRERKEKKDKKVKKDA